MSKSVNAAKLAKIPPGAHRVQVIDGLGNTKYKRPAEVLDDDTVCLDASGDPIVAVKGPPGRPKRPEFAPVSDERIANLLRLKTEHLKTDPLLDTLATNPESSAVLDHVMSGIASEAAHLDFEREVAERLGQPTSQISMRRINALKAVGDSWLKRKEQVASQGMDLESTAFKRLFGFIMETYKEVFEALGQRPELVETVFATLSKRLDDDWKREATKRMLGD